MRDTTDRLPSVRARDPARALAVIGEAVWWVTIVDATLVRYHPDTYDRVLNSRSADERLLIEETLAGLRFVRNQMGHDVDHIDFVRAAPDGAASRYRTTGWRWSRLPEPDLASLSESGQAWELTRYRAYQEHLAGRTVGETFGRAAVFLLQAAAEARPLLSESAQVTGG